MYTHTHTHTQIKQQTNTHQFTDKTTDKRPFTVEYTYVDNINFLLFNAYIKFPKTSESM